MRVDRKAIEKEGKAIRGREKAGEEELSSRRRTLVP